MNIINYLFEFLGTSVILFTMLKFPNPFIVSLSLLLVTIIGENISGAHVNPAVSILKYIQGELKINDTILYIVFQILGAFFALSLHKLL